MSRLPRLQSLIIGTLAIAVLSFALLSPAVPSGDNRAAAAELAAPTATTAPKSTAKPKTTATPTPLPTLQPPSVAVPPLPDGNLLANPSFANTIAGGDDPTDWSLSPWGAASIGIVSNGSVDSEGGSLLQRGQNSSYVTWQEIPVEPGESYRLTGWVNISTFGGGRFKVEIVPMTKFNGVLANAQATALYDSSTSGWVEVTLDMVAPTQAAKARVQMKTESFSGLAYADHLAFVSGGGSAAVALGAQTATATPTAKPANTATSTSAPASPTSTTATGPVAQATSTATATTGAASATATATPTATPTSTAQATSTSVAGITATPTASVTSSATAASTSTATPAAGTATATATALPMGATTNDDFDSATIIGTFPYSSAQDTTYATVATDDPDMGNGAPYNSNTVWFRLVAPKSGSIRVTTAGSSYDTVVAVFTGTRGNLSSLAVNDDANDTMQSEVAFNAQAGTTYYLEIAQSWEAAGGQLQIRVESSPVSLTPATPTPTIALASAGTATATPTDTATATPSGSQTATPTGTLTLTPTVTPTATPSGPVPNDEIEYATGITSFPYSSSQNTRDATRANDDPDMGNGTDVNSNTVWYKLVAPNSGSIRVKTEGSDYDTVVAAYTGGRGSLDRVAMNDDADSTVQSDLYFNVQSGTTYYIEVAQYGGDGGGDLRIRVESSGDQVEPTPTATAYEWATAYPTVDPATYATYTTTNSSYYTPPTNDDISSAVDVTSLPFSDTRDTRGATAATDDPNMGVGLGTNSYTVWYRYLPTASGNIRVTSHGSDYDTVLAAFSGTRGQLTLLAGNDDAVSTGQSALIFTAKAGSYYYLEAAQFGSYGGGQLQISMETTTDAATGIPTPGPSTKTEAIGLPTATPEVLGAAAPAAPPIPAPLRPTQPVQKDNRYFAQTGFRVNQDAFWDFFQKRGGVRTFGYPISWEFPLFGFKVQFFQRGILQQMPDGSVAAMNLLDTDLMPYNQINFSTFPLAEKELADAAPAPGSPQFGQQVVAFLQTNVPDEWEGMKVNFHKAYTTTVKYEDAFPNGGGEPALVPLLNLELWGLPTSKPAYDPHNHGFVYQRFQRGIMVYDTSTGATQGLLLADYLKGIVTGEGLPLDLEAQAKSSRFYHQLDKYQQGHVARPVDLPGTNLEGAFDKQQ